LVEPKRKGIEEVMRNPLVKHGPAIPDSRAGLCAAQRRHRLPQPQRADRLCVGFGRHRAAANGQSGLGGAGG